ncbi:hypothetical protein N5D61_05260 [Pseudomonas sp. GD03842]|jgi:septal ring factor EnvC (AmiA/AmiB activator)|uniref:hypothetical protein n=1 Tax=Pseudomonas sp. GD03842 TaxID=2975385 RepID=UPI0024497C3C|nr:hypothetical protein [Pseudomonas sp. GD03842]MDH0745748.1 hypothetical protein [Pseudomonas sp. GD03842]
MFETLPTTLSGWLGWVAAAVVTAVIYFPKAWSERRGDNREIDRLVAALAEERALRKDVESQRDAAREQNNTLIREFADIKADNAKMTLQIGYLTDEIASLKAQIQSRIAP